MALVNPFKDLDVVQKTQYKVPPTRIAKKTPPEPWPMPDFQPFLINNWHNYSKPNLPPSVDLSDPFTIFSLFFTEDIMDKLIGWLNTFIELHQLLDKEAPLGNPWPWELTSRIELLLFIT